MKTYGRIYIRANAELIEKLTALSEKTGRSKSAVIRTLIDGGKLNEMPSVDYHKMTAKLHAIGNNLNQIAHVANATGDIDAQSYRENADELFKLLYEIKVGIYGHEYMPTMKIDCDRFLQLGGTIADSTENTIEDFAASADAKWEKYKTKTFIWDWTDISALIEGEKLWIQDTTMLIKRGKDPNAKNDGTWVTCNLNTVAEMDKAQGRKIFSRAFDASANLLIALASIIVPILKPMSVASKTMKIAKKQRLR